MTINTAFQLTALTTRGIAAVKTYRKNDKGVIEVEGYGRAKTFTAEIIDIDSKGRWLEALRKRAETFVVLGAPINWRPNEKKRRLSQARDGAEATLSDVPRALMPVDIDAIDFEPWAKIDDGEMFAQELLERLGIKGVRCVWHLTSGHGFFKRYRARLWLELSEPATAEQMRAWAKSRWGDEKIDVDGKAKNLVDFSVYQPQQPIYTSDPVLEDGIESPVRRRVGFIDGDSLTIDVAVTTTKARKKKGAPDDENITKLDRAGLYIKRLKPGQHCVRCPWEDAHTGPERDDDTFYFEPHFNGHDIPAYKCHHDSCADKQWHHVLDWLGEDTDGIEEKKAPNWVYVHRLKCFWDARDGSLVERESYDTTHAGVGGRGKPSDRFIAMKRSEKADAVEFLPGGDRFIARGRLRILNTYVDQRISPDETIDVAPWIEHLEWLVPDVREREHLMDWLAWSYQQPGNKITWAPILYSKSFGVGKTTVFNALAECIGKTMVSEPTQAELEDKFNDWCYGKLLVKIEELMSGDKYHVAEKLKPVVTNPSLSIRRMHQTGFVIANVANVCASTNHMQALPIEKGDRRWMMIQCVEADKATRRPRMKALHRWLEDVGYGGIANWFASRDVSGFRPRSEAPSTQLRELVAQASMTDFDRAIELCDVFDKADLISSAMISEFLLQNDCKISDRKFGLIAHRRGWVNLDGQEGRVMVGGRKLTFWTSQGKTLKLRAFIAKKPGERERIHSSLLAKAVFSDSAENL